MITIDCHYNLKEDIHFILETEKINMLELSERTGISRTTLNEIGKESYMTEKLMKLSNEALLIKLADINYNLRDSPSEQQEVRMFKNLKALLMERKDLSDNVKHLAMLTFSV